MGRSELVRRLRLAEQWVWRLAPRFPATEDERRLRYLEQLEEAQHVLERTLTGYRQLYDAAPVGFLSLDEQGIVEEANSAAAEMLGRKRRESVVGFPLTCFVPHAERERWLGHLRRCRSGESRVVTELAVGGGRGSEPTPVLARTIAVDAPDGRVLHTALVDIAERKRFERSLEQRQRALDDANAALLARRREAEARAENLRALTAELGRAEQRERKRIGRLLHDDVQQLLAAIRVQTEMLAGDADEAERGGRVAEIDDLIDQAIAACRDLTAQLTPPILNELGLGPALHWFAGWLAEKQRAALHVEADDAADPGEEGIRSVLFEAARELVFNALRHAGTETIRAELTAEAGGWTRLAVMDEGAGFAVEEISDHPTEGFGLISLRERIEWLGGCVDVRSAPGAGTRVELLAPRGDAEPGTPPPAACSAASGRETAGRPTIHVLVCARHGVVRAGLLRIIDADPTLAARAEAPTLEKAVELAGQLSPDVAVIQVPAPGPRAAEATRRIRALPSAPAVIGLAPGGADAETPMRAAGACALLGEDATAPALLSEIHAAAAERSSPTPAEPDPPRDGAA